jgi:hypothetical protein
MPLQNQKDFYVGVLFALVGSAFAWGATDYQIGTSARMGPGYFPMMLGILLAVLGAVMVLRALVLHAGRVDKIGPWAWRPLVFIISANLAFGVALGGLPSVGLPALGLIAAIYVLTLVACLAGDRFHLKEAVVLATVLAVLSYVAFVLVLKLQLVVWPAFWGA